MIALRGVAVALLSGSLVVAGGCGGKKTSTMEPTVEQGDGMSGAQTDESRAARLAQAVEKFAAARQGLQGHSDDASRRQLAQALGELSEVLTLLKGSQQGGEFRQQVRIIDRARTQLTSDSATAPEPTVNAALRAAQRALEDMARDRFADDAKVKEAMDDLRPRVDGLAGVRGPIHAFETARALDALGTAAERMADAFQQRMEQARPATAPAATNPE